MSNMVENTGNESPRKIIAKKLFAQQKKRTICKENEELEKLPTSVSPRNDVIREATKTLLKHGKTYNYSMMDFEQWIETLERHLLPYDLTEEEQFEVVKQLIDDTTYAFLKQKGILNLHHLKNEMRENNLLGTDGDVHWKLRQVKQNGRPLPDFIADVRRKCNLMGRKGRHVKTEPKTEKKQKCRKVL
jgi:hypothetical protein